MKWFQQNRALGEIFAAVFTGPFSAPVGNDLTPDQIIQRGTPTITPRSLVRSNSFDQESLMGKIDHALGGGRLSGRYAYFNNDGGPGTVSGSGLPATGDSWIQFKAHYYLYAILFLIFDVEVLFLLPFAVAMTGLPSGALIAMLVFILLLAEGLVWAWARGHLEWK